MIFSKSRPVKIVLVGTGGTGGYIVPQLYRLLYALDRPIRVILCDGDLVEEKNLGRQNFIEADLGKNKAMVLAERYSNAFGIETSYIPQYVEDEEMLEELLEPLQYPQNRYVTNQNGEAVRKVISEIVILIGAVDNNRSRQVFHSVFQRAKELIYIDSGNSKASGQVICGEAEIPSSSRLPACIPRSWSKRISFRLNSPARRRRSPRRRLLQRIWRRQPS